MEKTSRTGMNLRLQIQMCKIKKSILISFFITRLNFYSKSQDVGVSFSASPFSLVWFLSARAFMWCLVKVYLVSILSIVYSFWFLLGSPIASNITVHPEGSHPVDHCWGPKNYAGDVMGPGELCRLTKATSAKSHYTVPDCLFPRTLKK